MGNCVSDVKGGKQAVGGGGDQHRAQAFGGGGAEGKNDAVDFYFRAQGQRPLGSQIQVFFLLSHLPPPSTSLFFTQSLIKKMIHGLNFLLKFG